MLNGSDKADETTRWWRDRARAEMGAKYAEATADADAGWSVIAASGAKDIARVSGLFRHAPDLDALEIGCGVGRLTVNLAPMFRSLLAVDIAEDVVAEAASNCRHVNATFDVVDGVELYPHRSAEFDVVFSAETFHHIQGKVFQQYLDDAFRLLRGGGQVVLHVNIEERALTTWAALLARRLLWLCGVKYWRGWPTHPGFRRQYYSADDIAGMMRSSGFVNIARHGDSAQQSWFVADRPG